MTAPRASFYAVQHRLLAGARLFKVFVTEEALCGARIAGRFYHAETARHLTPPGLAGLFFGPLIRRWHDQRYVEEARYDGVDPDDPAFLDMHGHNFRLDRYTLQGLVLHRPPRWVADDNPLHCGHLVVRTWEGRPLKLQLIELDDFDGLHHELERLVGHVEVQP